MAKQLRELQPAHKSERVTVAQAARAFRAVRGSAPKREVAEGRRTEIRRDSGRVGVIRRTSTGGAAARARKLKRGEKVSPYRASGVG